MEELYSVKEKYYCKVEGKTKIFEVITPTLDLNAECYFVLGDKKLAGYLHTDIGQLIDITIPKLWFKGNDIDDAIEFMNTNIIEIPIFIVIGINPPKPVIEHFQNKIS